MSRPPDRFVDGQPIPPGYLDAVARLVDEVCDIEELFPSWELEQGVRHENQDR